MTSDTTLHECAKAIEALRTRLLFSDLAESLDRGDRSVQQYFLAAIALLDQAQRTMTLAAPKEEHS